MESDLRFLVDLLIEVAGKWDAVCLHLGVSMPTIRNISASPRLFNGAPRTWLQEGLFEWLHAGSTQQPCTVSALCAALRAPSVDEAVLADSAETELNNIRGQLNLFRVQHSLKQLVRFSVCVCLHSDPLPQIGG